MKSFPFLLVIMGFVKEALDRFFYPKVCCCCEENLENEKSKICLQCLSELPYTQFEKTSEPTLIHEQLGTQLPIEKATSLLYFKSGSPIQNAFHHFKYRGVKDLSFELGALWGQKLQAQNWLDDIDFIIPIPLHPLKLKIRTYNQSEWIAKGIQSVYPTDLDLTTLYRKTHNVTQTKLNNEERWENIATAFGIDLVAKETLAGKHLLILDDMLTTGATLVSAGKTLLEIPDIRLSVATLGIASQV